MPADERDPDASPSIDRLADQSVVFEEAIPQASWTLPSFAAILTSTLASANGCKDLESRLPESFTTFPELFQRAGFDTFGVASHIFFRPEYGLQQGFDGYDASLAHKRGEEGWIPLSSPHVAKRAIEFLDAHAVGTDAKPFLLFVHDFDPHIPYYDHDGVGVDPSTEHARYRAEIRYTDRFIGRILDAIESNGLAESTVVCFLSDHGEAWEEHPGVRRHARSLFREELQVPFFLRVPGIEPRRVGRMVRMVDVMPTLLELFGIEPGPDRMEGVSLVPLLLGREVEIPPLVAKIELHPDQHHRRAIADDRWILIETQAGTWLLFDRREDPGETRDVAAEHPDLVAEMRAELDALQARARAEGASHEGAAAVELAPEDAQQLEDIGYGGK